MIRVGGDLAVLLLAEVLAVRLDLDHPRALGPGVVDVAHDAVVVPLGDDRGVVGIVLDGREHAPHRGLRLARRTSSSLSSGAST